MISLAARLVAVCWVLLTLVSLAAGVQALMSASRADQVATVRRFLARATPLSRWQWIVSVALLLLLFRAFFSASVNTELWPWVSIGWVALLLQLLWLKAHLAGYVGIVERGFQRPITRYLAIHVVLDVLVLVPTLALATVGLN